jgi:hypothetical protein
MLEIRADLQIELRLDPARERDPELHAYLSRTISPLWHRLKIGAAPGAVRVSWVFQPLAEVCTKDCMHPLGPPGYALHDRLVDRLWTASLNLDFFATICNLHGEACLNQAGSLRVPIPDLMSGHHDYAIQIPSYGGMSGHSTPGVVNDKGRLRIKNLEILLNGAKLTQKPPPTLLQMSRSVAQFKQEVFMQYISSCVELFQRVPSTWKATADINA